MRLVWEYGDTLTYSSIAADEVTYDSMFGTAIVNLSAGDQVITFNGIMPIHIKYRIISSVVEFKRWWVLKWKIFAQESTSSKEHVVF